MAALPKNIEEIHPSLWKGSQLARAHGKVLDTGYSALSKQLPGGGWPVGGLIELMIQQSGIGELRLLRPALLASPVKRPIALLQPPQVPNALGFSYWGIAPERLMWLRAQKTADALWTAEQILRTGSIAALLFWLPNVRPESLRRLHLAAQSSETLFVVMRPLSVAQDASPATLRITVRPAQDGVTVDVIKRKGPTQAEPFDVALQPSPILLSPHGRSRRSSPVQASRIVIAEADLKAS